MKKQVKFGTRESVVHSHALGHSIWGHRPMQGSALSFFRKLAREESENIVQPASTGVTYKRVSKLFLTKYYLLLNANIFYIL